MGERLTKNYFREKDALKLAQDLLGKTLVRKFEDGLIKRYYILETEAYLGMEDGANHASKGRTKRTQLMFEEGGVVYVYLIYGMYWLLNFVTGPEEVPQAVLIRGITGISGPGRIGRALKLDASFYGEDLETSQRIWVEESQLVGNITTGPRVGVDYAPEEWRDKPWRFILVSKD